MKEIDFKTLQMELQSELGANPTCIDLLRFLESRKRSADDTDISQLLSYLKKSLGHAPERESLINIFRIFEKAGIGQLSEQNGRLRFHWVHWIFPLMSPDKTKLLGVEFKPRKLLRDNRNLFRSAQLQAERYSHNLALPNPNPQLKPDIVFANASTGTPRKSNLEDYNTDEILNELKRRGFDLKVTVSNS